MLVYHTFNLWGLIYVWVDVKFRSRQRIPKADELF
jgi:hypothetical protein